MRGRISFSTRAETLVLVALACVGVTPQAVGASDLASPPGEVQAAAGEMERITLAEALTRALSANASAVVARHEIDKAEGLLREAQAAELPSLIGNGIYTRLDHDRITPSGIQIGSANQWSANLLLTVPLLVPTAWAGVHRATSARNLARASAADVQRELAATVARAYLGVVLQRRVFEVAARARDTAQAHFYFAHTRLAGGVGTSLDDVRAEQELRNDEAQVSSALAALTRTQAALAVVVSSDHPVDVVDEVPLAPPPNAVTATRDAQAGRTDVKVLEARLTSARHANHDVWTLYSPYLTANGQGFVQDIGSALQPTRGWQAQLVLTLPFYDGGIRTGAAQERSANEAEARVQLEATLREVAVEVRTAFEVVRRVDEALGSSEEAARLARHAAELADLAYRAGATTNLEVIDAERRARDAETQAALAEYTAREARLDLLLATGRFP